MAPAARPDCPENAPVLMRPKHLIAAFAALVLAACGDSATSAGGSSGTASAAPAPAAVELLKPQAADIGAGSASAPVTVFEYASMTCGHCARFHVNVLPEIKKQYVETGKVRFFFRDFPLDPIAASGALLARCAGEAGYLPFVDLLFRTQQTWAFGENPREGLIGMGRQAGIGREKAEACMKDEPAYKRMIDGQKQAQEVFGVNSTPSFVITSPKIQSDPAAAKAALDAITFTPEEWGFGSQTVKFSDQFLIRNGAVVRAGEASPEVFAKVFNAILALEGVEAPATPAPAAAPAEPAPPAPAPAQ